VSSARSVAAIVDELLATPLAGPDEGEFSVYLDSAMEETSLATARASFERAVAELTSHLGEADLRASLDDGSELPDWAWATDLAVVAWRREGRLVAVRLEHAAPDLPYAVVIGVKGL
jgi:hypothetical protein